MGDAPTPFLTKSDEFLRGLRISEIGIREHNRVAENTREKSSYAWSVDR